MNFWNINIDDWRRGRLHLDENISAYMFHTTTWYGSIQESGSQKINIVGL
jgi:hypothetical protein